MGILAKLKTLAVGGAVVAAGLTGLQAPASAAWVECAKTSVNRTSAGLVVEISVKNVCSFALLNYDTHVFNGPAGRDRRTRPAIVASGQSVVFSWWGQAWYPPPGSLTCGEFWSPSNSLAGRDCVYM